MDRKKISSKKLEKRQSIIKKIFVTIALLILLALLLTAALGNIDAIRTLWKTP